MPQNSETNIYDVLNKLLGVVNTIVCIPIAILLVLSVGYLFSVLGVLDSGTLNPQAEIKQTLMSVWEGLLPIAKQALTALLPIVVLILIISAVKWVLPSGAFSAEVLTKNLTSIVALVVLATLCILPLLGQEIPLVLSNIALVIVGYYFGKLKVQ
ncbi:hypothetical protein ACK3ZK_01735 [Aeromonas caviae]